MYSFMAFKDEVKSMGDAVWGTKLIVSVRNDLRVM